MQATPCKPDARIRQIPAFSLIELLAVMAIIAILFAAAAPIFSNSATNARIASGEIIKAHLQRARAHAIATSTATAVAIPVLASGGELGARSISLFEVELNGTSFVPSKDADGKERMLQRWETLPGNFHFLPAAKISSSKPTIADSTDTMQTEVKGVALTCHIIVFAPSGQIVRPSSEINIAFAQAKARGNSLTLTQKSGGKPVSNLLRVNRLTGRTRFVEP